VNNNLDADADGYGKVLQVMGTDCADPNIATASHFFEATNYTLGTVYISNNRFLQASTLGESSGTLDWLLVITQATACPAGTYEDLESVSCKECIWPATSAASASSCNICDRGYFMETDGATCTQCPQEALCNSPGSTLTTLPLKSNFWRPATHSLQIMPCLLPSACPGVGTKADGDMSPYALNYNMTCGDAYEGIMCNWCIDRYYLNSDEECKECQVRSVMLSRKCHSAGRASSAVVWQP